LLKPGRLTPDEFALMQRHTTIGAEILTGGSSAVMGLAEEIALNHHEHWDGRGYPTRKAGDAIPVAARIVGLVDAFDALSHARPYRPAWALPDVLQWIQKNTGSHFDPRLVKCFLQLPHERLL
jgi:putative two-component system response regulator